MEFTPYENQKQFLNDKGDFAFMAGPNLSGRTTACAFACYCHATGDYPDWWKGIKFNGPCSILVMSETDYRMRDSTQKRILEFLGDKTYTTERMATVFAFRKIVLGNGSTITFNSIERQTGYLDGQVYDYAIFDCIPPKDVLCAVLQRSKKAALLMVVK